jgi:hypothetical protein
LWCEEFADVADGFPQVVDCAGFHFSKMGFEFGECHLDGVEIRAIGWQEQKPSPSASQDALGFLTFVGREVVENDDIAFSNLRLSMFNAY